MGFFRALFAYLMHNDRLIEKLANSKPIRRSAQFVAYLLLQSKTREIYSNREVFIRRLKSFKEKLQAIKDNAKKNSPK